MAGSTTFPTSVDDFVGTPPRKVVDLEVALIAVERVTLGPTHYNVSGYPQATFDLRFAAALADAIAGGGVIVLPPGAYSTAGLGTVTKPTVSIRGSGSAATVITYTGSTAALTWDNSPDTVQQQGSISGLTIIGTASAQRGFHLIDTGTCPDFNDVVIQGFTGAGAVGIDIQNVALWNERATGHRVHLNGNTIGIRMTGNGGFNSFFYHRWSDLRINLSANQIGIQTTGTALLQGGLFNIVCNIDGNNAIMWDVGAGTVVGGHVYATGEQTTGTGGIIRRLNGTWTASGRSELGGCVDSGTAANLWSTHELRGAHTLELFPASPTVVAGAGAGTTPPAATVFGNDMRMILNGGTGIATAPGAFIVVTYNSPFPLTPIPVFSPYGNGVFFRPYISAVSTTGFTLSLADAPTASQPGTTYAYLVHVRG